mgnify:CR=1 FL=1
MAPRKGKGSVEEVNAEIVNRYIQLGQEISPLTKERKTLGDIIKKWLGKRTEAEVEDVGTITYKQDEGKEVEEVDLLALKTDYPKVYAKVVKTVKKEGKRRLLMPGVEAEE